jgi:hypothetical protein
VRFSINTLENIGWIAAPPQPARIFAIPVLFWTSNTGAPLSSHRTFLSGRGAAA